MASAVVLATVTVQARLALAQMVHDTAQVPAPLVSNSEKSACHSRFRRVGGSMKACLRTPAWWRTSPVWFADSPSPLRASTRYIVESDTGAGSVLLMPPPLEGGQVAVPPALPASRQRLGVGLDGALGRCGLWPL